MFANHKSLLKSLSVLLITLVCSVPPAFGYGPIGITPSCLGPLVENKALYIFGSPLEDEALKLSDVGTSARFSGIESKLLNVRSREGLMRLLDFEKGRELVIDFLVRTGVIRADSHDRFYPRLVLASKNIAVDLRTTHPDPAVDAYLKASKLAKKAEIDGVEPILLPRSKEAAKGFFYWEVLKALDIIQDSDTRSRDVVVAVFTEVGRARERSLGNEQTYLTAVETILHSVYSRAIYVRRAFDLPAPVVSFIGQIPFADPILQSLLMVYAKVFEGDRELKTEDRDASFEYPGREQVPGSFRLLFTNRDLLDLKHRADAFYQTYLGKRDVNLFSPEFVDALEKTYPELHFIRNQRDLVSNNNDRDLFFAESQFGPITFEGYKVVQRAAIFIGILRGDASVLPALTPRQFSTLRRNIMFELDLTYRGSVVTERGRIEREKVDAFMTFLFMDALGKGRDPFLDALDNEHSITKSVGADYERRAKKFLEKYRLSSYSFARASNETQERILRLTALNYEFNAGQLIQMESSAHGLNSLADASVQDLSSVYYRSLLSFAAIPTAGPMIAGSPTLTAGNYGRWEVLGNLLQRLGRKQLTPEQVHGTYVNDMAKGPGLPSETSKDKTIIKLAYLSDMTERASVVQIRAAFESLAAPTQRHLIELSEMPVMISGGAAIMGAFRARIQDQNSALKEGMAFLSRIVTVLENQSDFQYALRQKEDSEIRLQVRDLARRILELPQPTGDAIPLQIESLSRGNFRIYPR